MSGNDSIRGYLVQTLISVLDSLEKDSKWISITVEPLDESEKVDIFWEYDSSVKVTQVKSTKNTFKFSNVENWCQELEIECPDADLFELVLVGHCQTKVHNTKKIGKVDIPQPRDLNIESLLSEGSDKLDHYYERRGKPKINASLRRILVGNLVTHLELASITGELLSRDNFDEKLLSWIADVERQVSLAPYISLAPVTFKNESTIDHEITKKVLELIGWHGLNENLEVAILDEDLDKETDYIIDFSGSWLSKLKDETRDFAQINSRLDDTYLKDSSLPLKEEIDKFNSIFNGYFLPEIMNGYDEKYKSVYCILFWFSSSVTEHETNVELINFIREKQLDEHISYIVVDNNHINFLASATIAAHNYREGLKLKFLYPITEANMNPENIGQRDLQMPPEFLNSRILPIVKEDANRISVLLFCKDSYDPEHLKKVTWLLVKLTSGFGNEYIIYFPDFDSSYRNEVLTIISEFNNSELSEKLRVEKYESLNSKILAEYPLPQNLRNETNLDSRTTSRSSNNINDVFTNQLPYGDILKPFLNTEAVTPKDIKFFLAKRGVFIKGANRKRLIEIMCARIFSPLEIEDFKTMIEVKDKPLKSVPEYKKLVSPTSINEIAKSLPTINKSEILKDLDVEISGNLKFKQNPANKDEIILNIITSSKDLTNQLSLNTTWGKVIISMKIDESENMIVNTINTSTKADKILANRIIKKTDEVLITKNIIQAETIKIQFSQFQSNEERVNFLLSFSEISSSKTFKEQDISSIKFKYDEVMEIPENLRDKKEHDLVTYFNGRNLAGLSELSDIEFKKILLLDSIIVEYGFSWLNVSGLKCKVKYGFSNAIFSKTGDGEFISEFSLIKNYQAKKISNLQKLEQAVRDEIENLKMEKIKAYNLI